MGDLSQEVISSVLYLPKYETLGGSSYPLCEWPMYGSEQKSCSGSNLIVKISPNTVKSNSISSLHLIRVCNLSFFRKSRGFVFENCACSMLIFKRDCFLLLFVSHMKVLDDSQSLLINDKSWVCLIPSLHTEFLIYFLLYYLNWSLVFPDLIYSPFNLYGLLYNDNIKLSCHLFDLYDYHKN